MNTLLPAWAYSKWWLEFATTSQEYRKRIYDFNAMCSKCGLPIIVYKNEEAVDIVFISQDSVPDKPYDGKVVCAWCGTEKGAWDKFYVGVGPEPQQSPMVRIVSPQHILGCKAGAVDTNGCVWVDCPHKRIWRGVNKAIRKSGGGRMIA